MKKIGSVLITLLLMGSTLTAFADDSSKTIVQKIREANIVTETTEKAPQKSFKERL